MELTVYGPLRAATGDKTVDVTVNGETAGDVIDAFVAAYPRAAAQLEDSEGRLRPSVRILVDGDQAAVEDHLPPDPTVALFPAMRGG
ncbi:ubiquitin-like small modifier protein 1 [Halorientalis brevis]|uniref:Ubiquitin-like small modifier protein 1 n=1 Tax=Halorientalis brevis TaxID=1126241 RepID=A0ABD6CBM2_9EURY